MAASSSSPKKFAQLLTEGVYRIRARESITIQVVESELGYALGKNGGASIQHWRKGHLPPKMSDVETLAREIARRGKMERPWLDQFLRCAGHPDPSSLCNELFPEGDAVALASTGELPGQLPMPLLPLIGREQEVASALQILKQPDVRMLTLTGAPGVGKTRLALQVAAEMRPAFAEGVIFISLAPLRDLKQIGGAIAQALGVLEAGDKPLLERLIAFLRNRQCLFLLDNCEHLVAATPQLGELLRGTAQLKVLATSREPLRVYGEHQFPLAPLTLPALAERTQVGTVSHSPAVQLFVKRAQAVNPAFLLTPDNAATVAEICVHLDGLPLAIELVAARSKIFSPEAMLVQLSNRLALLTGGPRDLPVRHQTLRDALDWSYHLLTPAEQTLFARLSVFVGGCNLESVATVCGFPQGPEAAWTEESLLKRLESLLDKSLLQCTRSGPSGTELRFTMLATLLEYARYQLDESGEAETVQRRYRDWCLQLAERSDEEKEGPHTSAWLKRLEQEHANLRAALAWGLKHSAEAEIGLRLASALRHFWVGRGFVLEGRQWLEQYLAAASGAPAAVRAKALLGAAELAEWQSDWSLARAWSEESLTLWRDLEDTAGIASALFSLARVEIDLENYASARAWLEESLVRYRELENKRALSSAACSLGFIEHVQDNYQAARRYFEESLALAREIGTQAGIAKATMGLGKMAESQGEMILAHDFYQEGLSLYRSLDLKFGTAHALQNLAGVLSYLGDSALARSLGEECLNLYEKIGNRDYRALAACELARVVRAQGDLQRAKALLEESLVIFRELGDKFGLAWALGDLGEIAGAQGDEAQAVSLCEAGIAVLRESGRQSMLGWALLRLGQIVQSQGNLPRAKSLFKEALAIARALEDKRLLKLGLTGLAGVSQVQGHLERAGQLVGAAAGIEALLQLSDRNYCERTLSEIRTVTDESAFNHAWDAGRAMPLSEALAGALAG